MSESEQTKRLYRKAFPINPDAYVEPYWIELRELSRRLDALEAAKGKKEVGAHEAGCPAALCDGPCICRVAPPQPSNDLKDSVGERIVREFATRIESDHDAIIAAINAAVAEANTRAEKAEAEVKRLRNPGWIEEVPYLSEIRLCFREHFARHAEDRPHDTRG